MVLILVLANSLFLEVKREVAIFLATLDSQRFLVCLWVSICQMCLVKWEKLIVIWATLTSQRFSGLLWYRVTACTDVGAAHSGTFKPNLFSDIKILYWIWNAISIQSHMGNGGLKRSEIEWKIWICINYVLTFNKSWTKLKKKNVFHRPLPAIFGGIDE